MYLASFVSKNKKPLLLCLLFAATVLSAFAEDGFGLDERIQVILNVISSPWLKGVACIALVIECIALITAGRQEPGMFKKFVPWIAGTILFMAAGTITGKFVDLDNTSVKNVLTE